MTCPWCGSSDVHQIGGYASLLMTAQWFCDGCGSPFERIRHRGSDADDTPGASGADAGGPADG